MSADLNPATPASAMDPLRVVDERLAELDAAAERILAAARPVNTEQAFAGDWRHWEIFCRNEGVPPTSISAGLLVAFATWLAHPVPDGRAAQSPATISRRLAGVLDGWHRRKLHVPHGITSDARKVVAAHHRHLVRSGESTGRGQATALTIPNLRRISEALPDSLMGIRDRSIITLGFAVAGRRSEIAALAVDDVQEHPQGLRVRIRDSKSGERTVAVRPGTGALTCPVGSWRAWLDRSGIVSGPAFRRTDRWGNLAASGLTGEHIGGIVARSGRAVGLKLTGHSLRSGLATEARRAGHDVKTIAKQGGWRPNSPVLYGYMQIVDEWADNATEGLGL